jgi:hypothetical protein
LLERFEFSNRLSQIVFSRQKGLYPSSIFPSTGKIAGSVISRSGETLSLIFSFSLWCFL